MITEVTGQFLSIFTMPLHPDAQCLQTLKDKKCIHRRERGTGVSERYHAATPDIGRRSECLRINDPVIGRIRLVQHGKPFPVCHPVKGAGVDYHAADRITMTADVFRQGVNHDICPQFNRATQIRRRNRTVNHQGNTMSPRYFCQPGDINDIASRVANRLTKERPGVFVNGLLEAIKVFS